MKVYIKCPPRLVTGGPEFLHQVCAGLRENGIDAYMFYEDCPSTPSPQAPCYTTRYDNPWTTSIPETPAAALIVPEIYVKDLFQAKYHSFTKFILWESINFYLTIIGEALLNFFPPNTIHLSPTKYADEYLSFAREPKENIITVTDYISKEFLNLKKISTPKENLITYYAPKGNQFTNIIVEELKKKYNYAYLPLEHYSTKELIDILSRSKVFLDFSYFPGKNRMHREASVCDNIIFTSSLGAAKYKEDVNIKDEYKFNPVRDNLKVVEDKIHDCIENYDKYILDFKEHKEESLKEKEIFDKNIKNLAERIKKEFEF